MKNIYVLFFVILILIGAVVGLLVAAAPTGITLMVLGGIIIFYLTFARPSWIIAGLLCIIPLHLLLWLGGGITTAKLIYTCAYMLLIVSWISKKFIKLIDNDKSENLSSPVTLPLIIFILITLFSSAIGIFRGNKFTDWTSDLNALIYYGVCFVMVDVVKDKKILYRLFLFMVIATILGFLKGINYIRPNEAGLIVGGGSSPLRHISAMVLSMLMISTSIAIHLARGRKKAFFILTSFSFGIMLMASFVRSFWVAAFFSMGIMFFMAFKKSNFMKFISMIIVLISLYILTAISLPFDNPLLKGLGVVGKRYESMFTARDEPSLLSRGSEWREATRKAMRHPFLGNGLGTQFTYFRYDTWYGTQMWQTARYVHNVYLKLFLTMGLMGLASFLWLIISLVRYGISLYGSVADEFDKAFVLGATCAFIALLVGSLAEPIFVSPAMTLWIGFYIGALIIIDKQRTKV